LETDETIYGYPIYFSFTIPNTAENIKGAISFVEFLLSENGKKILEQYGLNPIKPILNGDSSKLKPEILSFIQQYN
jgi:molybdate/tungstate transport system substrate-binding protein